MIPISIPQEIETSLNNGATLILSCSGGKDSDAMSYRLLQECEQRGWSGEVLIVHADLGRMERSETPGYVEAFADRLGLELVVVRHPKYDLLEGFRQRMLKLHADGKDAPPFSSSAARFCTSDWKRAPISKFIRNRFEKDAVVICAMGLRGDESNARAKKPIVSLRPSTQAPTKNRVVYNWNPIHKWNAAQVWWTIREHGNSYHPAYDSVDGRVGNDRLSCGICILGCSSDHLNGAYDRPETYQALVDIEIESGFTFQHNKALYDLAPELLRNDQIKSIAKIKAQSPQQMELFS